MSFQFNPFQSTLPRGERRTEPGNRQGHSRFQSTLPRGERQASRKHTGFNTRFQSTLPRGERQANDRYRDRKAAVSIHAPAWGATIAPVG